MKGRIDWKRDNNHINSIKRPGGIAFYDMGRL